MSQNFAKRSISKEMIGLLQEGDKKTFSVLYDVYSASIFGILLKIVEDPQLAEDLLQEVFVKIFSEIKNFDSEKETLFIWIYKIAKQIAFDSININFLVRAKQIKEILKTNPHPFLELIYFRGFTIDEVVQELNIPKETVQKKLRKELKQFIQTKRENG